MMLAAVIKDYFATANGVSPRDLCSCSVMPCVRKQGEADRPWFETETPDDMGTVRDVDHVMTTVELANILKERGINLQVRTDPAGGKGRTCSEGGHSKLASSLRRACRCGCRRAVVDWARLPQ